jgi:hypothetical protein
LEDSGGKFNWKIQVENSIGRLNNLNQSVECPIIKNFDRTKGKIWPDNFRRPALFCRPEKDTGLDQVCDVRFQ